MPYSAIASMKICNEALRAGGFPDIFFLFNDAGNELAQEFVDDPRVALVSFTGSTRAGILVAKSAADTVKRVHQELGGKSPNLVLPDAKFEEVLPPTVQGVLVNTGQSCIALTRSRVHKDREAEAAGFVKAMFEGTQVGDPLWRLPLWDGYDDMLKSDIADMVNAPDGGFAGAITAALFLRRFTEGAGTYVHFDIYGWQPSAAPGRP